MDMYGTPKWLLCLKAVEQFITDYSRAPGYTSEDLDTDAIALRVSPSLSSHSLLTQQRGTFRVFVSSAACHLLS